MYSSFVSGSGGESTTPVGAPKPARAGGGDVTAHEDARDWAVSAPNTEEGARDASEASGGEARGRSEAIARARTPSSRTQLEKPSSSSGEPRRVRGAKDARRRAAGCVDVAETARGALRTAPRDSGRVRARGSRRPGGSGGGMGGAGAGSARGEGFGWVGGRRRRRRVDGDAFCLPKDKKGAGPGARGAGRRVVPRPGLRVRAATGPATLGGRAGRRARDRRARGRASRRPSSPRRRVRAECRSRETMRKTPPAPPSRAPRAPGTRPERHHRGLEPRRLDAPRPARARAPIRDRALLFEVAPL